MEPEPAKEAPPGPEAPLTGQLPPGPQEETFILSYSFWDWWQAFLLLLLLPLRRWRHRGCASALCSSAPRQEKESRPAPRRPQGGRAGPRGPASTGPSLRAPGPARHRPIPAEEEGACGRLAPGATCGGGGAPSGDPRGTGARSPW